MMLNQLLQQGSSYKMTFLIIVFEEEQFVSLHITGATLSTDLKVFMMTGKTVQCLNLWSRKQKAKKDSRCESGEIRGYRQEGRRRKDQRT
jgi:hypothetical protein